MGNSLAVQWLEPHAFTAESLGSIPGWGTKILQAMYSMIKKQIKTKQKLWYSLNEILLITTKKWDFKPK